MLARLGVFGAFLAILFGRPVVLDSRPGVKVEILGVTFTQDDVDFGWRRSPCGRALRLATWVAPVKAERICTTFRFSDVWWWSPRRVFWTVWSELRSGYAGLGFIWADETDREPVLVEARFQKNLIGIVLEDVVGPGYTDKTKTLAIRLALLLRVPGAVAAQREFESYLAKHPHYGSLS